MPYSHITRAGPTAVRRSTLSIAVHWLSALAVLGAFALAWGRELLDDDVTAHAVLAVHRQFGLAVLLLLAVRLWARWCGPTQGAAAPPSAALRWAAHAAHGLLYALLLAMPLLGWAMTNAHGHLVQGLWVLPLPTLVPTDPDLADALQQWHEWGAWCLVGLLWLHVSAALWHHLVRRDEVLVSMWPRRQPASRPK
ncbi:MAG: cytochrome b [Proteobacteria bacterium]|jgi:cytochrome b561|nr:cytochrome b [Pseudomonadota bacterium]